MKNTPRARDKPADAVVWPRRIFGTAAAACFPSRISSAHPHRPQPSTSLTIQGLSCLPFYVDTSRPWQEPDGEDVLAALPPVTAALAPIARHVTTVPSTQWWSQGRQVEQWAIDWRSADDPAPLPREPLHALSTWARGARAEEVRAAKERPRNPHANYSGTWWPFPQGTTQ